MSFAHVLHHVLLDGQARTHQLLREVLCGLIVCKIRINVSCKITGNAKK